MTRSFLFLLLLLPFPFALNLGTGVDLAITKVLVPLFGLWWLFAGALKGKVRVAFSLTAMLLTALLLLATLSFFQAQEPSFALRKILFLAAFFPLFFIASDLALLLSFRRILNVLLIPALALALLGTAQFLLQFFISAERVALFTSSLAGPVFWGKTFSTVVASHPSWFVNIGGNTFLRALAIFPDPHTFALYLGMVLPFAFSAWFCAQTQKEKHLFSALALLLLFTLLLTFSRAGYAALIFSGAFFFWSSWRFLSQAQRRLAIILPAILILLLAPWNPIGGRFLASFNPEEGSFAGRLALWKEAVLRGFDAPFFGIGLGNFPRLLDAFVPFHSPINAHNTYLELFVELGILGPLLFSGLIFLPILAFIKKRNRAALSHHLLDSPVLPAAAAILFFAVHSFFETTLYSAVTFPLFLIFAAFLSAPERETPRKSLLKPVSR